MSALDRSVVERVAALARIQLTEVEIEHFTGQLSQILGLMDQLAAVDTSNVAPTASVLELTNVLREDEIRPGLTLEQALSNAPSREGDFFRVQTMLEQR